MSPETSVYDDQPGTTEVGPHIDAGSLLENRRTVWISKEINNAGIHVEKYRAEAKQSYRFRDGKQLSEADMKILTAHQRPTNAFNTAQKFIRFVTGVEAYAPEALIFEPRVESDETQQDLGEFITRTYDWALAKGYGNYERSRAFEDLIVTGMGWEDYYIDRGDDPAGLPAMRRIPYDEMWFPLCPNQNLAGSRWRARESYIDRDEALARWPEQTHLIRAAFTEGDLQNRPEAEGTVEYIIPYIQTKPIEESGPADPKGRKVKILEFQWYDDKPGYYFYDPLEQEDTWYDEETFKTYHDRLKMLNGKGVSDYVRRSHRMYQKIFLLNRKHELGEAMELKGGRFTFNCMTGHYDEEEKIWYGFMRVLIDPQRYANKFFNQVLEIMGHQAKGGGMYEEGAIKAKQVEQFQENYSKPGSWNEVAPNALKEDKIREKKLPELPTASMTIIDWCTKAMETVSGFSPESAWGQSGANVPGVTNKQRQRASLLLLSKEFSSLSRFRIEEGEIILELLKSLADDRLIRVGAPLDSTVVRLLREPFMSRYDLSLDDTERDPNIRHLYTENVMMIAPTLIRMGKFLPELLDYFVLPVRIRRLLKRAIVENAQREIEMAQRGIRTGGRGSPVTPEERAAKVQKIHADTQVQLARAERIKGQKIRDEIKIILEALVQGHKVKMERDSQGTELAAKALELFDRARGITAPGRQPSPGQASLSAPAGAPEESEGMAG